MSRATAKISYDGPALRDGAMDVRDLAPALLAAGQLFEAANAILHGPDSRVKVQVVASEPGSFQIILEIAQSFYQTLVSTFAGPDASAAANLVALVFGVAPGVAVAKSLVSLIKWARGRSIEKASQTSENTVAITIDGTTIEIPVNVFRLYQDLLVRSAAQKLIHEPLSKDGIDTFEVFDGSISVERIEKPDAGSFIKPQMPDDILIDQIRRSAYSIISLAFKQDNKWRLNDGNNPISANTEDQDFLRDVDNNLISFSKGDILICDVRVVQKQTDQGLKTEYTVTKVIEHRPAARQLRLPLPGPNTAPGSSLPSSPPPAPPR